MLAMRDRDSDFTSEPTLLKSIALDPSTINFVVIVHFLGKDDTYLIFPRSKSLPVGKELDCGFEI